MRQGLESLSSREYPGRILVIGQDSSGVNAVIIYAITGRSPSSQARKLVVENDAIWAKPTDEETLKKLNILGGGKFYKGKGCKECSSTGYKGRIALTELLIMNDSIDEWIDILLQSKEYAAQLAQGDISLDYYRNKMSYSYGEMIKNILCLEGS